MKILPIIGIVLLCACEKEITKPIPPQHTISFTLDSALSSNGKQSLPLDKNGFYHLKLSPYSNQTLTRITGTLLVNGKPNPSPSPVDGRIEWTGSHYWVLKAGESVGAIIKTYFNPYTGQLQTSQLPNLISQKDVVVPIVNGTSQLGYNNGEINTMAAPIYQMKGDTITIVGNVIYTIEIPIDNLFSRLKTDSIQKSIRIICD
jgi:hypothetical protein